MASNRCSPSGATTIEAWAEELSEITSRLEACTAQHNNQPHRAEGGNVKGPRTALEASLALWGPSKSASMFRWTKTGYQSALHKEACGLPLVIRCGDQWGAKGDETEHQSMRDIERDVLSLNGVVYKAGLGGYPKVVRWLTQVMQEAVNAVSTPEESYTSENASLEGFSRAVLRSVNRTNSGGAAYDTITQVLALEGVTNIVPDSKKGTLIYDSTSRLLTPVPSELELTRVCLVLWSSGIPNQPGG